MTKASKSFSILFVAPAFILYTVLVIIPVIFTIYYSMTDWNGISKPDFSGVENYLRLFTSSDYWRVVGNTVKLVILTLLFQVPLGLIFAYLLFKLSWGFKLFRTIYFMPVIIAPIAIGVMFSLFYNGDLGPLNNFLGAVGLEGLQRNWLSDSKIVLYSVIFPQVWQYIGLFVVIMLASLQSIPQELFESAEIDGANSFRVFRSVVIPLMREVILICIILAVTGSLKSFDHAWAISKGGPGSSSSYIAILMYKEAFKNSNFGYASAVTMTIMLYALTFTIISKKVGSKNEVQY